MKALVLGGNGFIGSHVVDALLMAGHNVRVFDRGSELYRLPLASVDYRLGSFSDIPALAEAIEGVEVVYHLISTTVPSTSNLDPVGDIEGNLVNTVRLLQLMVQKGVRRIVYLSSGGTVYGTPEILPIPESHPLKPICSYGVVKIAIEKYLYMFQALHGVQSVVLRASNPYGERQGHSGVQGVIGAFIGKLLEGQSIEIWGDGNVVRDFIYVTDLAQLCVLAGEAEVSGVFNVGSGLGQSINDIISILEEVMERSIHPVYKPGRIYDVPRVVLDVTRAKKVFGWSSHVCLEQGIVYTWKWAKR